jgi:hypothetical protein
LELHYSSVSFNRAAAMLPGWEVVWSEAAGPAVSIVILWLAVWFTRRSLRVNPLVVAMGLVSSLRFFTPLLVGGLLIIRLASRSRGVLGANVDEYNAALAAGMPPLLLIVPTLAIVAVGDALLLRSLPQGQRLWPLVWLAAGTAVGSIAYFYLGPLVSP